ncbi:5-methyltetrahydropteroyltriglutamate--homocysteine S-methyltransferase [uncultured Brachyspira sp.]|uniref:5-methyltetrahydropteroyltriglutamate-- homocysteine S-methyltransferase n=1 Tax=uncultured Brachyspira sp. TaxID=221953 RepID=UPI00260532AA|nr:5-methyltetrahydropteroyltriglutamate--homocysteine S-methyltransferase [uncultured Brachyspira sp.]
MGQIIGFPRIGENRELKKSLELFWASKADEKDLEKTASELRKKHWHYQKNLDNVCVNDFSFYDNMLDLAFSIGAISERFKNLNGLECYFSMARGNKDSAAYEMTKWFNTNYHYVVPELSIDDKYKLNIDYIIKQYNEAKSLGYNAKISLIGLFTFVGLSKIIEGSFENVFNNVKNIYFELLDELSKLDKEITIEFHEPIFVKGENDLFFKYIKEVYNDISQKNIKAIVTTYFEHSNEATDILLDTDIFGIGLDFVYGHKNLEMIEKIAKSGKTLYAGIIDARNIWISNLENKLQLLNTISQHIPKNKIVIGSSCSLLHVPYSKDNEKKMDKDILSWLSFSLDKIREIEVLENIFFDKANDEDKKYFEENININKNRMHSKKINDEKVQKRMNTSYKQNRDLCFKERIKIQRKLLNYPNLASTTIGSYPQTDEIRTVRMDYKKGKIKIEEYEAKIKEYIKYTIEFQESIDLDVLVHGEPERNDMVEYFAEYLNGFVFSENAWVQSYGSRCVKPPIIYGDISRNSVMTVKCITYAQSLTKKIVKGMLTGPVTILNWSFVRNDIERSDVCRQIAFAISDEINDLQNAGIKIIQVDEAAFKEGYPLRKENIKDYEKWAVDSFKIASSIAKTETQIHTHMCYSDFNDIIKTIEKLDADVISIETSRSGNKILKAFKSVGYSNEIGLGVYDIHSPRIPSVEEFVKQINALLEVFPKEQLWINPDCGLKTRKWEEVKPSLKNMTEAVKIIINNN